MKIYLIPIWLEEGNKESLSQEIPMIIGQTKYFLVENLRTARRFISALKLGVVIDDLIFFQLDKKTTKTELENYFKQIPKNDKNNEPTKVGIMSEAGCPGIADPGALAVEYAHKNNIEVVPLVGASSILLALMASGFNGQNFAFHGYLSIDATKRKNEIKSLESESQKLRRSQIFMETPYRNNSLLTDILKVLNPKTKICVASNITSENQFIKTKTVAEWKKEIPDLHKIPTIFVLYAV
ncbi:SAM-dependent methyltransferase [Bernardetia sp. Wsw4-3y2]|uniref:SAM-dependent methyltransferase n=1 Tax=Bernardetia sp. Wsw4-3y2 TaxID=3127471 RepID=UPI0030CF90C1